MWITLLADSATNLTPLIVDVTWSGARNQAARQLNFSFIQSDIDPLIPNVNIGTGYTVQMFDDDGNLKFHGNIYEIEKDRAKNRVNVKAYDNLHVLAKSKTTRKFENITAEEITRSICAEMGVLTGDIAATGKEISFIANAKTGFEIIKQAYTEAAKQTELKYMLVMNGDRLDVVVKGTLIDVMLDASTNMTDSIYKESIENLINRVLIVDESGNGDYFISDDDSIRRYSMFQTTYKVNPEKDTATEAKALFTTPNREGNVTALGDFRAITGYSITVRDANFTGQFWIKSDTHTFRSGFHEMKLTLEYEKLMFDETK